MQAQTQGIMWSHSTQSQNHIPQVRTARGASPGVQRPSMFLGGVQNSTHQVLHHMQAYQQPQASPWTSSAQFNPAMQAVPQPQGLTEPWTYPAHIPVAQQPPQGFLPQTSNQQWNYAPFQGNTTFGDRQILPTVYEKDSESQ